MRAVGKNNIIEINGKRYDARTGAALSSSSNYHVGDIVQPAAKATAAKTITIHQPSHHDITPKAKPASQVRVHDAIRAPQHPANHKPQRSKTLMRAAVKKPAGSLKRHVKAQSNTDALVDKPSARLQPKSSVHRLDNKRLQHARNIPKSASVSRFSKIPLPTTSPDSPVHIPTAARPPAQQPQPRAIDSPMPKTAKRQPQTTSDFLERAVQQATSHLQPPPPKPKKRSFGFLKRYASA
jgi:hypothetical protein